MGRTQNNRFDRLRELAEKITSNNPAQHEDFQNYDLPALINELQVYQAELEVQNDELRAAQSKLEQSRQSLSRLFHMAPVGYVLLDAVGMMVDVNQTLCQMLKTERDELLGKPFSRQILTADQPLFLGRFKSFYKNPKNKFIEVRLIRQDDRTFFAKLEGRFLAEDEESDGTKQDELLLMVSDISEQKQAERQIKGNERYLHAILQTTVDGFWVIDRHGRVVEVNEAYCTMSGYTREELLGLEVADLDAIETPEEAARRMQRIIAQGSEIFETCHLRKDGSVFPLEVSITWLETKGGQFVCFCRDLTERKQQEEALRSSEARWQFALEGARDGVWDWDVETNHVFFSQCWAEMLGYEPREISSDLHEWERRVHPEDMPAVRRDLENHFQGKTAYYQNEHRMLCKDGSYKWVLDRGKVVEWTEDGRPRRVIGTHADITEQKQREAEREALIRDLQEAMSEVKTLSGLLPICANCKKIRDDQGYWNQIEIYIQKHSDAEFSHGICRECAEKLYPDLKLYDD